MNKEKEKTQKLSYQSKMLITKSCYQCHVQRTLESLLSNEKELKVGPKKISFESTFKAMKFYGTKVFQKMNIKGNICVYKFL
jgi:hypothetical protein